MLLALLLSAQALALNCDEVMNLARLAVPEPVIVETIEGSGEWRQGDAPELIACLEREGASPTLVAALRTWAETSQVPDRTAGEPATTQEKQKKPEPPPGPPPLPLPEGLSESALRRSNSAVALLLPRVEEGSAEQRALAGVWLGQALLELGMLHSAERFFLESAHAQVEGPSTAHAWLGLRAVAERSGDLHALEELVFATPLERWPRGSQGVGYWLTGLRLYEASSLSDARKVLAQISERDPELYLRGLYLQGIIHNTQGKLKSGVKCFRDVFRHEVPEGLDPAAQGRISRLKDLSVLNIARVYYSIERFDEAEKFVTLVPARSELWDESRLVLAWSRFMRNKPSEANAALDEVSITGSDPEHALLRALISFATEDPTEAASRLAPLEAERPSLEAMKAALSSKDRPPGELYARWLAPDMASLPPQWLLTRVHHDAELSGVLAHIAAIDAEAEIAKRKVRRLPEDQLARLREGLPEARALLVSRAEARLRSLLEREHARLADLLRQAEIIRMEVIPPGDPRQVEALRALLQEADGELSSEIRFRIAEAPSTPAAERQSLLEQILVDTPDYARNDDVMLALAELHWLEGRRDEATAQLQRLLTLAPESRDVPRAQALLGDDAFERRDWAAARARYQAALIEKEPVTSCYARYRLAWVSWAEADHAQAVAGLDAILREPCGPEPLLKAAEADHDRMRRDPRVKP